MASIAGGVLLLAQPANAQTAGAARAAATGVGTQFESQYWASVDGAADPALYEAYLAKYPNGTFADLARIKLMKLRANAVSPQNTPQMPPPVPQQVAPPPAPTPMMAPAAPQLQESAPSPGMQATPGLLQTADRTPLQSPVTAPNSMGQMQPETAMRSSSPLAHRPAAADGGDGGPYVTKAVPAAGEPEDSKLDDLLSAIRNPARTPAVAPSPSTPLPPSAPSANPAPTQVLSYPAPVTTSPAQTGYAPVQPAPQPAPGMTYGTPSADPGNQKPIVVGTLPAGFALPPRPILIAVPPINLPESFCSADARNAYHNNVYRNAVEAATRNYDLTGAYLRELQDIYDRYSLSGTTEPQNAVASEARAYKQISDQAFFTQSALVNAFKALMAVPIIPCG